MTDTNTSDTPPIAENEISLLELWQVLVRHKYWVLGIPLIAMIGAFGITSQMKPQWEATGVMQIGQAGQTSQPIEPVARIVERMKLKTFPDNVLASVGVPLMDAPPRAALYRDSLKAKLLPSTDLIEIKVRGHSREEASANIEATVAYLRAIHDRMAAPATEVLQRQLARVELQIKNARAAMDGLRNTAELRQPSHSGDRFMANIELASTMLRWDTELRGLEHAKATYEEQLNPSHTYPTSLFDKVFIGEGPVAPRKVRISALSGLVALVVGMVTAFALNSASARRRQSMAAIQSMAAM